MNVEVPEPVPLDMPPGNAGALTQVVQDVAGAAFHLNVLAGSLTGPAAAAPGWLGDDAAAAVEQVGASARLAERTAEAVLAAMHRLSAHAECLHEARRRVAALEREQQEDFRATWVRLSAVEDPVLALRTQSPEWVGPIDDLRASEESRRRRHAAVLEEVADDAAATARVLADSCGAVGGRGAPGDGARVMAHFAAQLPGWGDRELARSGRALADALVGQSLTTERRDELARRFLPYADSSAFATSLLAALDVEGVGQLLVALGYDMRGPRSAVARILAGAFGAAEISGDEQEIIDAVFTATYVDADDRGGDADMRAAGMAAVLAAGMSAGGAGVRPETLVHWGRQLLARERTQGVFAGAGAIPAGWDPVTVEPVRLVIDLLAAGGQPGHAAGLLADREAWDALLARGWGDGGASLSELVALAGADSGPAGTAAVRFGLEALGNGLADNDPDGWSVNRATAAAVAGSLADGIAAHIDVAVDALAVPAAEAGSSSGAAVLRGLGYLTIDRPAATSLGEALAGWAARQPLDLTAPPSVSLRAVAVPGAYLAVQEYGQRLAYALEAFERKDEAEDRQSLWNVLVGWPSHIPGGFGDGWGTAESGVARLLGNDGSWTIGPDNGLVFTPEDAVAAAVEQAESADPADAHALPGAIARQVRAAFDRTAERLGSPEAPIPPPEESWTGALLETATDAAPGADRLLKGWKALLQ